MSVNERKISLDYSTIDDKIILNDDKWLVRSGVIASEIVQQYDNGRAYKPDTELEMMAENAELVGSKPIKILTHPNIDTNYLIQKQSDVFGKVTNFRFVKNLLDAKTQRPCRRGVLADFWWNKKVTPANVIEDIVSNKMRDCSIGFSFDVDASPGEFNGAKYDYVQRNIYLDHVAAPIPAGRCPGPICGIGYDSKALNQMSFDAATCPVCRAIKEVGFEVAGKRIWKQWGGDALFVIEGNTIPTVDDVPKIDLDADFNKAINELKSKLS